jgi:hypothetical protein
MPKRQRRRSSFWAPHRVAMRILFGPERNHPTLRGIGQLLFGPHTVASIRRDTDTGTIKARGARRRPDGTWERASGRRARTYRGPATGGRDTAQRAGTRRTARAQRSGRGAKRSPQARNYRQGAAGRMTGAAPTKAKLTSPAQVAGLTKVRCSWCRGSAWRPLYTREGRALTVIGVVECNHAWAVDRNGPAQKAPARSNKFTCHGCASTGQATITLTHHGAPATHQMPCPVCKGWTPFWNASNWGTWTRKQGRRRTNSP